MKMKVSLIIMIKDWEWFFLLVLSQRLTQVGIEMKSVQFSSPSRLIQSQEAEKIFVLFLEQKYVEEVG